jgi:hypothetical protein
MRSFGSKTSRCGRAVITIAASSILLMFTSGCFLGDRAADRTVELRQVQGSSSYMGPFLVDASRLPADAVQRVDGVDHWGNPVTSLTISEKYPVQIVLMPATQP